VVGGRSAECSDEVEVLENDKLQNIDGVFEDEQLKGPRQKGD
jgi:hypothetical protein